MMIDDNWQRSYGDWEFRADRFDDPKGMIRYLHEGVQGHDVDLSFCYLRHRDF